MINPQWLELPSPKDVRAIEVRLYINEPAHDKTYSKVCVTSKDSDRPVHTPSMARVYPPLDSLEAVDSHAISEDSDQTARVRRLI